MVRLPWTWILSSRVFFSCPGANQRAPLAACCSVTFRPVLKTPSSAGDESWGLLRMLRGFWVSLCVLLHMPFPPSTTATQGSGCCSCPLVCACVSRCTCGARGQLVGVDFSFCHERIWNSGGDWGLQVVRPGSRWLYPPILLALPVFCSAVLCSRQASCNELRNQKLVTVFKDVPV